MINIEVLRNYFLEDMVLVSDHAAMRLNQRDLKVKDIKAAVNSGEIIEQYPDDYPFPSCLIIGKSVDGKWIHVVMSDEGSMSRIITAYYPDPDKWSEDFRTRKEK